MQATRSSSEFRGLSGPPGNPGIARTRRPRRPRPERERGIGGRIRALLGAFALVLIATATLASTASAALPGISGTDPDTLFPTWYKDSNGVALQLCLDGAPNCLASRADLIDAHAAGGDGEAFYYEATATVGGVTVANALEAAYAADGLDQEVVFMRTQISNQGVGGLSNVKYTITDPYGTLTCTPVGGEIRNNACRTETTIVPGEFARAQAGRIGPFLTWDTYGQATGAPPAGYIGDNATPHRVVGSPTNFNKVRIEGPGINKTAADACPDVAGPIADCAETDLFTVQGKVQPGPSAIATPAKLDFGNVAATTPVTKSITYTSTGSENVTVSGVTLDPPNVADFTSAENCTTAGTVDAPGVAPGASCKIDITFTPREGASSAGTVTINDNTAGSPRTVALSGSSVPVLTTDKVAVGFGNQKVGTTSATDIVTIGNSGVSPLTVTGAALSGTGASHFKIANNGCTTAVGPTGGCEISVVFAPTSTSGKTASLDITDSTGKVTKVALTGTGTAPTVTLSPTSLTFPSTAAGASSTAQSVRVTNGGNAPLAVDLVFGGANGNQFKVAGGTCVDGGDLAGSGASCTVQVAFAPTAGGPKSGNLSVTTDLTTGNTVALSGTATAPADTQAPTAPTAVKGTVISQSAIDVTWTASTDNVAVAGYDIYRDANTTTPVGSVNGTTTTFHDTGLGASTSHTYRVVAFDGATPANRSALSAASTSVTTPAAPDTTAPSIPTSVTGTVLSSSSIRVNWSPSTDNVAVAGYKVFRDGGTTPVATVATGTTFTDTGLAAASSHTYTVSAFDGATPANESAKSAASASVTTAAAADTTAPSVPSGVTGTASSSSQIVVSWSPSTDNVAVAGYKVFRDGGATAVGTVINGTTTFTDTGLAASSSHTYTVSAFDGATPANESAKSAPSASVTTQAAAQTGTGIALHGSSYSANATATTLVIPAPAGAQSGDVEVMGIAARGNPTITPPAGWTAVRTDSNSTTMRQATYTHVVGATEPASYTWNLSSSQAAAGGIMAYGGVATATPVDVHGGQVNASASSVTAPTVTTTKANAQLVGFFANGAATTFTAPTGMTERGDVASTAGTFKVTLEGADQSRATAGATGTRAAAAAAPAASVGQLVALAPSGGTTQPQPADTQAPSVPTGVSGTATSSSAIRVSWTASTDNVGVAGYRVFRDGGTTPIATVNTGTSFSDAGLTASSTHTYVVEAFDAAGNKATSTASAPVTTQAAATQPPPAGIAHRASSFAANATATTLTIPKPATAQANDVAVMAIAVRGNPTITAPTGWTLVRTDTNSTTMRQAIYRKVLGATEPTSYTWTLSSAQAAAGGIQAYSGVSSVTPVDVNGGQFNASSTSVTAPSITTTKANAQVIGFFGTSVATTFTAPTGMTERGDVASSAGTFKVTVEGADVAKATTGATGTKVATAAAGASIGQLVALAP